MKPASLPTESPKRSRCVLLLDVCSLPKPICTPTSAAACTASPTPGAGYAHLTLPSQDRAGGRVEGRGRARLGLDRQGTIGVPAREAQH